jgi:hypothetical protein
MWNRTSRVETAWKVGEWMTVFGMMVWALGRSAVPSRPPAKSRPRWKGEAPAGPVFSPDSEDPDGGAIRERARRRRHID